MGVRVRSFAMIAVGAVVIGVMVLPMPTAGLSQALQSPHWEHWCGTDRLGRDVLIRTILGLRYTMVRALLVLVVSSAIGVFLAGVSILESGRWLDRLLSLFAESQRSFPVLVLALLFASVGIPVWSVLVAYFWIPVWRLVRSAALGVMEMPYVQLASLRGMSPAAVVVREILPNTIASAMPYFAALLSELVAVLAAIEFLGFGPAMSQPSLGGMLIEAVQLGRVAPWVWAPSLVMVIVIVTICAVVSRARAFPGYAKQV